MYTIRNLQDVEFALKDLQARVDNIGVRDWDLKGFRITNLHPSLKPRDAVVREEMLLEANKIREEIASLRSDLRKLTIRVSTLESV